MASIGLKTPQKRGVAVGVDLEVAEREVADAGGGQCETPAVEQGKIAQGHIPAEFEGDRLVALAIHAFEWISPEIVGRGKLTGSPESAYRFRRILHDSTRMP